MRTRKIVSPSWLGLLTFGFVCLLSATNVSGQELPAQEPPTQEQPAEQLPGQEPATQDPATQQQPTQEPTTEPSISIREDFSDDELKSFVKANERVSAIQVESEQKMIKAIEGEGLTVNRFNELLEQQRDSSKKTETSAEELKSFNNAAQHILEENAKIEKEMTSTIEEEGIDIETYKQIMVAYQQKPEIQNRVNKIVNTEKENK